MFHDNSKGRKTRRSKVSFSSVRFLLHQWKKELRDTSSEQVAFPAVSCVNITWMSVECSQMPTGLGFFSVLPVVKLSVSFIYWSDDQNRVSLTFPYDFSCFEQFSSWRKSWKGKQVLQSSEQESYFSSVNIEKQLLSLLSFFFSPLSLRCLSNRTNTSTSKSKDLSDQIFNLFTLKNVLRADNSSSLSTGCSSNERSGDSLHDNLSESTSDHCSTCHSSSCSTSYHWVRRNSTAENRIPSLPSPVAIASSCSSSEKISVDRFRSRCSSRTCSTRIAWSIDWNCGLLSSSSSTSLSNHLQTALRSDSNGSFSLSISSTKCFASKVNLIDVFSSISLFDLSLRPPSLPREPWRSTNQNDYPWRDAHLPAYRQATLERNQPAQKRVWKAPVDQHVFYSDVPSYSPNDCIHIVPHGGTTKLETPYLKVIDAPVTYLHWHSYLVENWSMEENEKSEKKKKKRNMRLLSEKVNETKSDKSEEKQLYNDDEKDEGEKKRLLLRKRRKRRSWRSDGRKRKSRKGMSSKDWAEFRKWSAETVDVDERIPHWRNGVENCWKSMLKDFDGRDADSMNRSDDALRRTSVDGNEALNSTKLLIWSLSLWLIIHLERKFFLFSLFDEDQSNIWHRPTNWHWH